MDNPEQGATTPSNASILWKMHPGREGSTPTADELREFRLQLRDTQRFPGEMAKQEAKSIEQDLNGLHDKIADIANGSIKLEDWKKSFEALHERLDPELNPEAKQHHNTELTRIAMTDLGAQLAMAQETDEIRLALNPVDRTPHVHPHFQTVRRLTQTGIRVPPRVSRSAASARTSGTSSLAPDAENASEIPQLRRPITYQQYQRDMGVHRPPDPAEVATSLAFTEQDAREAIVRSRSQAFPNPERLSEGPQPGLHASVSQTQTPQNRPSDRDRSSERDRSARNRR